MKAVKWKWQRISPIHFHDVWDPRHHMSLLLNRESPTTMRASQGLSPVKPAEVSGISIIKVSWVISLIKGCFIFSRKASKMQHEHLHGKGWGKCRYLFPEYSESSSGLHLPEWVYLNATCSSCSVDGPLLSQRLWLPNRYSHCKLAAF